MKTILKTISFLALLFFTQIASAQVPEGINYQAVVRNATGEILINTGVSMQITIQTSMFGGGVYAEEHDITTNNYGLVNFVIGQGTVVSGDFETIDWASGSYYVRVEADIEGNGTYELVGVSQLMSVPFAMHSKTAENYNETDPVFGSSPAGTITEDDKTAWDNKLDTEVDPIFDASVAKGITGLDTASWNAKLDSYTETDPVFDASVAKGITAIDTLYWNTKLDSFVEVDPIFDTSIAAGITDIDTAYWNAKLDSYTETDPVFGAAIAAGITGTDTAYWNNKSEFDGEYTSLNDAPNIANSTDAKVIKLNTNNNTSSLEVTKSNGTSIFKVDGSGRMTGDGSGLSNVKPLINYIGGNQRIQINSNYGSYTNVRTVTLTVPANGVCYATASGYVDWESTGWDLYLGGILMDQDPNSSWAAENEWYSYLNIITDYNCTDSSDQYTCFSQHRCFPVSAGTHTFTLWVNKYSSASKTELGDVNLTVMYFPTGGTGKDAMPKEGEPIKLTDEQKHNIIRREINPNSPSGDF